MIIFIIFLAIIIIVNVNLIIVANNMIYSIFMLIIVYICINIIFMLLNLDFLALMSLIIYAGAIAILFLFVIMMLNIKVLEVTSFYKEKKQYIPLAVLALGCVLLLMLISLINIYHPQYIESQVVEYDTTYVNYFQHINDFSTLVSLAAVLYDSLYFFVIIAAIILFLAMIAAIALTLKIRKKFLKQKVFVQLLRDFNKTVTVNNDSVKI